MKLKSGFLTHTTKGEHYIISTNECEFKGIIKNNETAAFIVECMKTDTTESAIADKIMKEYEGAERSDVECDVANFVNKLRSVGAVEE